MLTASSASRVSLIVVRFGVDELEDRVRQKQARIDEPEEQLTKRSRVEHKIEKLPDRTRGEMSYRGASTTDARPGSVPHKAG
jgi:hypothetical protein